MAKHRRQTNTAARAAAATTALAAGAALIAPAAASAAEVRVPNSPIAVQVPGIETIPGVAAIPGIDAWIPSLKGAAATGDAQAAIARVKALPGVNNVPGFSAFIANVEKQVLPAQAATNYSAPAAAPPPAPAPQPAFAERIPRWHLRWQRPDHRCAELRYPGGLPRSAPHADPLCGSLLTARFQAPTLCLELGLSCVLGTLTPRASHQCS